MGVLNKIKDFFTFTKDRTSHVNGFSGKEIAVGLNYESKEAIDFFKQDPVIFGACSNIANWVSSSEKTFVYKGRSSGKNVLKSVNEWAKDIMFNSKIRNWVLTHSIFDDVFIEVDEDNKDFYILDSETIEIRYDEKGRILSYEQNVNGQVVPLSPDKIIHFKMNSAGSEMLGISSLVPLNNVIKSKEISEEYTNAFFYRHATPRIIYKVPETWPDEQVTAFTNLIARNNPHGDFAIPKDVDVQVVGSPITDMQFEQWLKYLREQILVAMGLFPILIGLPEGSNKANSGIQFDAFRLRIRAIQNEIEDCINTQLLPRLFKDKNLEFKFKSISFQEQKQKADIIHTLATSYEKLINCGMLTPEEAKKRYDLKVDGLE